MLRDEIKVRQRPRLRNSVRVFTSECDPIFALQAWHAERRFQVSAAESVASEIDIFWRWPHVSLFFMFHVMSVTFSCRTHPMAVSRFTIPKCASGSC